MTRGPEAPAVLISAGPTQEPIDAVRYLGNRSSGRQGLALAEASARRGWRTTLLLGPTHLPTPSISHIRTLRFRTGENLRALLREHWPAHDVLIMAAAVCDFRPAEIPRVAKLRRGPRPMTLALVPTTDLLAEAAAAARPDQTLIGFALEPPEQFEQNALEKLRRKGVDAIVANPLETMDAEHITATVLLADGRTLNPPQNLTKPAFAEWLLDQLPAIRDVQRVRPGPGGARPELEVRP